MIARVRACIEKGTDPNKVETVILVGADDPRWDQAETLVSLYMYRVIGYLRAGNFEQELHGFMLKKAAQIPPLDHDAILALARAYEETWDGQTGDLDKLHEFVDAFTTKQLAGIGI